MPYGFEDKLYNKQNSTFEINFEFMNKILEIGKEYDVMICLENMPMRNFSIATPYEILNVVNLINDKYFKICLDTGHAATFPDLSVSQVVRDLGDKIAAFHIHDNHPDKDLHLWPYFGTIDWDDFSKALNEISYNGGLCLETAPPNSLPDLLYDKLCNNLFEIMKTITK